MHYNKIIKRGFKILKEKSIASYQLDTEIILSNLLGVKREKFIIEDNFDLSNDQVEKFNSLITRRSKYEPIAYIIRKKEFWKRNFFL